MEWRDVYHLCTAIYGLWISSCIKAWLLCSGSSPCYDPFLNPEVAIEIVFERKN
jgi:hypothetical protein